MADDGLTFDLSQKKKKKTKKYEFEDELEDKSTPETPTDATGDADAAIADEGELDDFSGLKKKKKKKKPFNLEDLDDALPSSEKASPDEPSENLEDMDFDFSSKKKKKKKKVIDADLADDGTGNKENEDDVEFDDGVAVSSSTKWDDSDRDYTYDELLELIYNQIKEKNPESETGGKKKLVMRPPQVLRVGTKKTSFANFVDISKSLHRQQKHLQAFLLTELGTSGSVDAANQLIIKGRFQQKQVESVLRKYIKEYVACQTCRSPDTILQKETRLFFLQCETCGSRRSVANIKSGFQAVTGRRAAMRARQ